MTVVTFVDYQPLARFDADPWIKAKIYEAATEAGVYTLIETITFVDPDVDSSNPKARSFTTDVATLEAGWYQVIFEDASADTSPTAPIHNLPSLDAAFYPLVSDVGAILRARTKSATGAELGTFTAETRPTYDQTVRLIASASKDVLNAVDDDIPVRLYNDAQDVIALGAALLVELSYFPEQVASGRSPYDQLKELYDMRLSRLMTAVGREDAEDATGDPGATGRVSHSFPAATNYLDKVM